MLDRENTRKELSEFNERVIQKAQANLDRGKHNASKKLRNSFSEDVTVSPNSISANINSKEYNDYGIFQDYGVNGKKTAFSTRFAFKNKMPPTRVFDKWIVLKGIAPRNEKGQFKSRKGLAFAIARSVFLNGIKPTHFFSKPFEDEFSKLPDDVVEAYGLDVESYLKFILE